MAVKIITISREFGSGGRFIGEEVAKKLGIRYYRTDRRAVWILTGLYPGTCRIIAKERVVCLCVCGARQHRKIRGGSGI